MRRGTQPSVAVIKHVGRCTEFLRSMHIAWKSKPNRLQGSIPALASLCIRSKAKSVLESSVRHVCKLVLLC
jgi:hypothetical protein